MSSATVSHQPETRNPKPETRNHNYVAIMAGGVGSRFWPGSREARPKQFMDMLGTGKSLLRLTFERFLPVCGASNIFVVTNAVYQDLVREHLPELTDNQIICEPSRNNTAPCVAYTAFKLADLDPAANFVIAPSDHIVLKEDVFREQIQKALDFTAKNDALVTLGLQPVRPDTGYGYINFGAEKTPGIFKVKRFTEKPDLATAKKFIRSGKYLWNAGIFVWNARAVLRAYETLAPEIFDILKTGAGRWNTPEEQAFINQFYPSTPNISVDFAIMEKAENVFTLPSEFGWSDLGTWASLFAECEKDEAGNVVQGKNVLAMGARNCLIRALDDKLLVVKDLQDYIIVDTGDALLIWPKSKEQEIKQVTAEVKQRFSGNFL